MCITGDPSVRGNGVLRSVPRSTFCCQTSSAKDGRAQCELRPSLRCRGTTGSYDACQEEGSAATGGRNGLSRSHGPALCPWPPKAPRSEAHRGRPKRDAPGCRSSPLPRRLPRTTTTLPNRRCRVAPGGSSRSRVRRPGTHWKNFLDKIVRGVSHDVKRPNPEPLGSRDGKDRADCRGHEILETVGSCHRPRPRSSPWTSGREEVVASSCLARESLRSAPGKCFLYRIERLPHSLSLDLVADKPP
jgi:hypothetical protein